MHRWASIGFILALAATTGSVPLAWSYATGNYSWTVAVSDDGGYVIAGSDDMHTYFFKTDASQSAPTWIHSAQGYVRHVAISSNGTSAASSDTAGNIYYFRQEASGNPVWSFHTRSSIDAIEISDDGHRIAAGDREGGIFVFDPLQSGSPIWSSTIPGGILALSLFGSNALAVTSAKGGIYSYDLAFPQSGYTWSFQEAISFPQLETSKDTGCIIAGGSDGNVYLISAAGQVVDIERLGGSVSAISISHQTGWLIAGSTNGNVSRYLVTGKLERLDSFVAVRPITAVVVSNDGERISVVNLDGKIFTFRQTLTDSLWTFSVGGIVHSLSMSEDGRVMAAASDTGNIYLFREGKSMPVVEPFPAIWYVPIVLISLFIGYLVLRSRMKKTP